MLSKDEKLRPSAEDLLKDFLRLPVLNEIPWRFGTLA